MAVKIEAVEKNSHAEKAGIVAGETLLQINGHEIYDVLDFRFYETSSVLKLTISGKNNKERETIVSKNQYDPIGLSFNTYLMDKQHSCRNKCIFCFIDQLPKGMRESLYFKDDDERLSFLFGNYITLTNLSDREIERIIDMHISPVNVSVHTTNPELRNMMMGNRFAGKSLSALEKFVSAGITVNCQIVLCPGINDDLELERTLSDLFLLGENIGSIACVPVGITRYREGLFPLSVYNEKSAEDTILLIERYGDKFLEKYGRRTVYASDEFFLIAKKEFPKIEYYEDFPQIENGVGMFVSMRDEFDYALLNGPLLPEKRKITVITGEGAKEFILEMLSDIVNKYQNFEYKLISVKNDFFGGTVNVSGLLTGGDIEKQVAGKVFGEEILLPGVALRHDDDVFLDDMTLSDLQNKLSVKITPVSNDGEDFLYKALGINNEGKKALYTYPENYKI